jgi:hypothetical protein
MLRTDPFAKGHLITVVAVGIALLFAFRAHWPWGSISVSAAYMGGAGLGLAISGWRLRQDGVGWKLWLVVVVANPVAVAALLFVGAGWQCVTGRIYDFGCIGPLYAGVIAAACFLPPSVGLMCRWWHHRTQAN